LGLRKDRTVMATVPTTQHVCYAQKRHFTPSLEHQALLCLGGRYPACHFYHMANEASLFDPFQQERSPRRFRWGVWAVVGAVLLVLVALLASYASGLIPFELQVRLRPTQGATEATTEVRVSATPQATITPSPTPMVTTPAPQGLAPAATLEVGAAPDQEARGQVLTLVPRQVDVRWLASGQGRPGSVGDSFLYAGVYQGQAYVSALRFNLSRVARGTAILDASLQMTGLRAPQLDPNSGASWIVQLLPESALPNSLGASFIDVFGAPADVDLAPLVLASDVDVGAVNTWVLDAAARNWIEQQRLDGASSIIIRIAPVNVNGDNLFAWDSGFGTETQGAPPVLVLSLGPPPAVPPPTPTRQVIVATLTPQPENVLTVVALTATPMARTTPTPTPTPIAIEVVTPTPLPQNLATVQAAALAEGRPAVVLHTPVPANPATATADAAYVTAVALTTGTFTPVPTDYVTPVLYYPSPPPENVATAAARAVTATAVATLGTPTPTLPWNAVPVMYVYATPTPANVETAVALVQEANARAATTGTPTPTPWNEVVITGVPPPTPTPIPLVIAPDHLTSTPIPTATRALIAADLERFRGKLLFHSNRTGPTQTWLMDPDTGDILGLVTDEQVYTKAREQFLTPSPDGKERAFVVLMGLEDEPDNYQIRIENLEYGITRDLTRFPRAANYDPAWSPTSNWIAFVSTLFGGDDIYKIQSDGEGLTRLTFNSWEWDKHPTWSPDGTQIAFYSNRETGRRQIWVMNDDGSEQRNLSRNEFEDWDPVWVR
jgi:hypothetical protein